MKRASFRRKKLQSSMAGSSRFQENGAAERFVSYPQNQLKLAIIESGEFVDWASLTSGNSQELLLSTATSWTVMNDTTSTDEMEKQYENLSKDMMATNLFQIDEIEELFSLMAGEGKGEAEVIRLLFTVGGKKLKEVTVSDHEVEEVLASIPAKKLPVLIRGEDEYLLDVAAAVRTLARAFHLLGETNDEHLVVEATYEKLRFLKVKHPKVVEWATMGGEAKDKVEWACHQLKYDILPPLLEEWNKLILASTGPFVVASGMTLADIAIMDFLDQCSGKIHLEELMVDHLALSDLVMMVKTSPDINFYLRERALRD